MALWAGAGMLLLCSQLLDMEPSLGLCPVFLSIIPSTSVGKDLSQKGPGVSESVWVVVVVLSALASPPAYCF